MLEAARQKANVDTSAKVSVEGQSPSAAEPTSEQNRKSHTTTKDDIIEMDQSRVHIPDSDQKRFSPLAKDQAKQQVDKPNPKIMDKQKNSDSKGSKGTRVNESKATQQQQQPPKHPGNKEPTGSPSTIENNPAGTSNGKSEKKEDSVTASTPNKDNQRKQSRR